MTSFPSADSIAMLTLPHEDPLQHAQLFNEWMTAYPHTTPIERGYIQLAVTSLIEKRRIERIRATLRTQKVRTAVLEWERAQEDTVANRLAQFNDHPPSALVGLLRSAAGCRWAIKYWCELDHQLQTHGCWFGEYRVGGIQLQGKSAGVPDLYYSQEAFTTWSDCIGCQSNPKQSDIGVILDRRNIPLTLQERGDPVWPRDVNECRARLQALVDRELPRLRALEKTLRVQYEEPAKAEAEVMALASVTQEEMRLLRAEQIHEQSYQRASTALMKARKQTAAARAAATPPREESSLLGHSIVLTGQTPSEAVRTQVVGGNGGSDKDLAAPASAHAVVARSCQRAAGGSEGLLDLPRRRRPSRQTCGRAGTAGSGDGGLEVTLPRGLEGYVFWSGQGWPDATGKIVIQAPRGLAIAWLTLAGVPAHPDYTMRHRVGKDAHWRHSLKMDIGSIDHDVKDTEIAVYESPILVVNVAAGDGSKPKGAHLTAVYPEVELSEEDKRLYGRGPRSDVLFTQQKDGRFRSQHLLPDERVTVEASADGYQPRSASLKLPEGAIKELELVLEKR